jgi:PAS domain S-box-containing protein
MKQIQPKRKLSPFKIAAIYAVAGGLWILFSDKMLASLIEDPHILTRLQTYKGWGFVAVTALLVYGLIKRYVSEMQKSEESLRESEGYNRNLFDLSPIGLALCRVDGALVDVNEAFAKIIGRTIEETLRLTYWDITPEKYADQEAQQLESLRTTGRYGPYEKAYKHKDGHFVPVRLKGRIIKRDGEDFIWSSVEDITERKKAELDLEKHRENLEELVKERTQELETKISVIERMNKLFVGRELRMIELKEGIKELEKQIGSRSK